MMQTPMIQALIDLASNPVLAAQFDDDPHAALAGRDLSASELDALASRKAAAIRDSLGDTSLGAFIVIFVYTPEAANN